MTRQILFSMKNKKNISKCRMLTFLPSIQSVNNVVIMLNAVTPHHTCPII